MARFERTPPCRISFGFVFTWWAAADALLPEPDQLTVSRSLASTAWDFVGCFGVRLGLL
jgi:hypothetical protein